MPKHIIEFDLPEETEDMEMHVNAGKMHSAIWDVQNFIRSTLKHTEVTDNEEKLLEKIRDMLNYEYN